MSLLFNGGTAMGNADQDLLAFFLRHGDVVVRVLTERAATDGSVAVANAARDAAWLVKVNAPDWSHTEHSADCMDDWSEARRAGMTPGTVEANHRLHMGHVERVASALRAQR